ncbi:unnamed protein product, partial [Ectocarpus sp. 12 AP-2014]
GKISSIDDIGRGGVSGDGRVVHQRAGSGRRAGSSGGRRPRGNTGVAHPPGARRSEGNDQRGDAEAARGAPGPEGEARRQEGPIQLGRPKSEGRRGEGYGRPPGQHHAARTPGHVETRRRRRRQERQEEEEVLQRKGVQGGGGCLRRSVSGQRIWLRHGGLLGRRGRGQGRRRR